MKNINKIPQKPLAKTSPAKKTVSKTKQLDGKRAIRKNHRQLDDRHMTFFKGILGSVQSLSEDETVRFQSGVANVLQRIFNRRREFQNKWNISEGSNLQVPPLPIVSKSHKLQTDAPTYLHSIPTIHLI